MGIYLATPNKEKHTETQTYQKMQYAACGMQGWRVNMEDAHIAKFNIAPDTHIFGVFDGHGGKEVAAFVARHFIDELLSNKNFKDGKYDASLIDTFLKMDTLLETEDGKKELASIKAGGDDDAGEYAMESNAGCTAVVCLMVKNELIVANAGDSRCVVFCGGTAKALSEDHKPELEGERNRIAKAGGYISNGRVNGNLNLSRALGDMQYKRNSELKPEEQLITAYPEIMRHTLDAEKDDMIILGCDGIWESLSIQQICEFTKDKIKQTNKVETAVEELLDNILAPDTSTGMGCDNMSVICVKLKDF